MPAPLSRIRCEKGAGKSRKREFACAWIPVEKDGVPQTNFRLAVNASCKRINPYNFARIYRKRRALLYS
ncbi:MAG: hypothetical protein IKQ24_04145, partial [Verrucomicrobia bacterium]|nr:hypothetical protein [Verrucomicrobiota bacterium]